MRFPITLRLGRRPPKFIAPLMPCNRAIDRCRVPQGQAEKRILIMRIGAHGDILMGTPLLAALRAAWPQAHITWLAGYEEREAIDTNPYIDEILLWDSGYWKGLLRRGLYLLWLREAWKFQKQLRQKHYDIFISFQPEEWPLLLHGIGAPINIGIFDTFRQTHRVTKTSTRTRLYTHSYTYQDLPIHRTDQYLLSLRALGLPPPSEKQMHLGYTADDVAAVDHFLEQHTIEEKRSFIVLAPMTTWESRCWPAERYVELANHLASEGFKTILIGSVKERSAVEGIAAQMENPPTLACGTLSFRQMSALIARAALLVSGDTGPMHVAGGVGTPYLALFGPTPPAARAPLAGVGLALIHPVPCGPCDLKNCPNSAENYLRCMRLLTVAEVLSAAKSLLSNSLAAV